MKILDGDWLSGCNHFLIRVVHKQQDHAGQLLNNTASRLTIFKMAQDLCYKKKFRTVVEDKFESLDMDKNGYVSLKEMLRQADVLEELCKASPEKIKPFRDSLLLFAQGIGFVPGKKLAKKEFVEAVIRFAGCEQEKRKQGKKTLYDAIHNAMFDIIDTNNDGTLSQEELEVMMKVFHNVESPGAAETLFKMADTNTNGKVERQEFIDLKFNLMFNPANV